MSGPQRYSVTVEVEAWQWEGTGSDTDALLQWVTDSGGRARYVSQLALIRVDIDGERCYAAAPGDWVVHGVTGSFFTKNREEFSEIYKAVIAV